MIDELTDLVNRRAAAPLEEQMVHVLRNMLANGGAVLPPSQLQLNSSHLLCETQEGTQEETHQG